MLLIAVGTIVLRLLFPMAAVGFAFWAEEKGWGLFNVVIVPQVAAVVIAAVALDFVIWGQHVAVHKIPLLWRLHRLHHADGDYDVTTGLRFHPLEFILSMLIKFCAVAALGAPPEAVLLFEVVLNASAMFNHGNFRLPLGVDRVLRLLIVTPDFHRVHHSIHRDEHDANYGFCLSIWDRVFRTYVPQPRGGHEGMTIGIDGLTTEAEQRLDKMLLQPFTKSL